MAPSEKLKRSDPSSIRVAGRSEEIAQFCSSPAMNQPTVSGPLVSDCLLLPLSDASVSCSSTPASPCKVSHLIRSRRRRLQGSFDTPPRLFNHFRDVHYFSVILFVLCLFCSLQNTAYSITLEEIAQFPTPPSIIDPDSVMYKIYCPLTDTSSTPNKRMLACAATGMPKPTYTWYYYKHGFNSTVEGVKVLINDNSRYKYTMKGEVGSFVIYPVLEDDYGTYVCHANNSKGVAIQRPIDLVKAEMSRMSRDEPQPIQAMAYAGEPFVLTCDLPYSKPTSNIMFAYQTESTVSQSIHTVNMTRASTVQDNDEGKGRLFFSRVEKGDALKIIQCSSMNDLVGSINVGNKFQFVVADQRQPSTSIISKLQYKSKDVTDTIIGAKVVLHCIVSAYNGNDIFPDWFRHGKKLDLANEGRISAVNFRRSLAISSVVREDEGAYKCSYARVNKHFDFTLRVFAAPYFLDNISPPNQNASECVESESEDNLVAIECLVVGKPTPKVTFFKDGKDLNTNPVERVEVVGNDLTIKCPKRGLHDGVYQCRAKNEYGMVWANFYYNFVEYEPIFGGGINDGGGPIQIHAVIGEKIESNITLLGSPGPTVRVYECDKTTKTSCTKDMTDQFVLAYKDNVLNLRKKKPVAAAIEELNYKIVAKNTEGQTERGPLKIMEILHNGKMLHHNVFYRETVKIISLASKRLALTVVTEHDAGMDVKFYWKKDGLMTLPSHIKTANQSLIIESPTALDDGLYEAVLEYVNGMSAVTKVIEIKIRDVPTPPAIAEVLCSKRATLTFYYFTNDGTIDPENPPFNDIKLQYRGGWGNAGSTEVDQWITMQVPIAFNDKKISSSDKGYAYQDIVSEIDLKPFGTYQFRAFAVNNIGWSAPSPMKPPTNSSENEKCISASATPDTNPGNVRVEGVSPNSVVVHYSPIPQDEFNGAKAHYRIVAWPAKLENGDDNNDRKHSVVRNTSSALQDHITVEDLETGDEPYQEIKVSVTTVNEIGDASTKPQIFTGHTGELPPSEAPKGFEHHLTGIPNVVKFDWDKYDGNVNGEFKGFKLYHWTEPVNNEESGGRRRRQAQDVRPADAKVAHFASTSESGEVYDMTPHQKNYAELVVYNTKHESEPSTRLSMDLNEGPASAVPGLHARAMDGPGDGETTKIYLYFNEPKNPNGDVTEYHATCTDEEDATNTKTLMVPVREIAGFTNVMFSMPSGKTYNCEVAAKNGFGPGDVSKVTIKGTPSFQSYKDLGRSGIFQYKPEIPGFQVNGIGKTYMNLTFQPGVPEGGKPTPAGMFFEIEYTEREGFDFELGGKRAEWSVKRQDDDNNADIKVDGLKPGTEYLVRAVSKYEHENIEDADSMVLRSPSPMTVVRTIGDAPHTTTAGWLIAIIVAIIVLIIIFIIVCLVVRNRGRKYPVHEKEKAQGREPMLQEEKGFGEYSKPTEDEKKSLTGSLKPESETDSMAEYETEDPGGFGENASYVGIYAGGANKTFRADDQQPLHSFA